MEVEGKTIWSTIDSICQVAATSVVFAGQRNQHGEETNVRSDLPQSPTTTFVQHPSVPGLHLWSLWPRCCSLSTPGLSKYVMTFPHVCPHACSEVGWPASIDLFHCPYEGRVELIVDLLSMKVFRAQISF